MKLQNHKLYSIWSQVPVTYYQSGVRRNILQKIWHTHKIRLAKKILSQINFNNCLDVGCASGYMISEIAKAYSKRQYFGIDVYDKSIDFAKKRYPSIKFKVSSADKLPYKDNFFDVVLCYETIEHVENPKECLLEMKRVLKKDGTLILCMDSGSLLFRIVWFVWENTKGRVWKKAHIHPFHHEELGNLIKSVKFKIKNQIFSFLNALITPLTVPFDPS